MRKTITTLFFIMVLMFGALISAHAHDTTRINPLITDHIRELIKTTDTVNQPYEELYKTDGDGLTVNWGEDPILPFDAEKENYSKFTRYNNVIDGVVQEDVPDDKVLKHFYQTESGIPLTVVGIPFSFTNSEERAAELFAQSLDFYSGYTDVSRSMAFFKFGQALHHVEDMTSPAHIHNDAHLDFYDPERDDYEGWYLPTVKAQLGPYLSQATAVATVTNPALDIWGAAGTDSLVSQIYQRSTYTEIRQSPWVS
jgi:hypothetical protein